MRFAFVAVVVCSLLAGIAFAGIQLDQTSTFTFTDCSSSGSAAQTVPGGEYLLTVKGEDVWLCQADSASTCASNGTVFPSPTEMLFTVGAGGQSISCRSTGSTGDLQLTHRGN